MRKKIIPTIILTVFFITSCVKDLDKLGIQDETKLIGVVVEKSETKPLPNIRVSVTDGDHTHVSTLTDSKGEFELEVNYSEIDENYYLLIDGRPSLPFKQEELHGMGKRRFDYKTIALYDKTNVGLLPQVSTSVAQDITAYKATVGGVVTADGGHDITTRGVVYARHQTPTMADSVARSGTGMGDFFCELSDLEADVTYYFRAFAVNSIDTVYGEQRMFTTLSGNPTITTSAATNITANSATLGGQITNDGGDVVLKRGVCWHTGQNPTLSNNHEEKGGGTGSFFATVTQLTPGTTYYVRAYAINSRDTFYAEQVSFNTTDGKPTVTTSTITNITASTASSGGNITSNGGYSVTARGICWNTTGNPDLADSHTSNGTGNGTFTANLTNLTGTTTYHVRAYATNSQGTSYGNELTFTTIDGKPTVTISAASNITATNAVLHGNVTNDYGYNVTERGFCWSTNQFPTISDSHISAGTGAGTYNASATNLTLNTTYYVRAYARNACGLSYSNQISFQTTSGLPTVVTTTPTLSDTTVLTGGQVTSDGGFPVTARGVCYGTFPNPDLSSNYSHTNNGTGTGYFSSQFNAPSATATYYVRAYATNENGTAYGAQASVVNPYSQLPSFQYNGHTYRVAPDPGNEMTASSAYAYCTGLTLYGYNDWRLPDKSELMQMYVERVSIGGFASAYYWSSSYYIYYNDGVNYTYYYSLYFGASDSQLSPTNPSYSRRVRPIRMEN